MREWGRQLAHGPGFPPCPVPPKKTELFTGKGFVHLDLLRPIQLKGKGQGLCPDPWLPSVSTPLGPSSQIFFVPSDLCACARMRFSSQIERNIITVRLRSGLW